jgi:site-specific DNA-methyltransferase (adenine-specific)
LGKDYSLYEDDKKREEYVEWLANVFTKSKELLKDDGSLFVNLGFAQSDPLLPSEVAKRISSFMVLQNNIVWVKSISINDETKGNYKPCPSDRFLANTFEHIFHFTKTGKIPIEKLAIGVPYSDPEKPGLHCRGNSWFVRYTYYTGGHVPKHGLDAKTTNQEWLTVGEASEAVGVHQCKISIAANKGDLQTNGQRGFERRIYGPDLNRWMAVRATKKTIKHPAMFPVEIAEMCIKMHGVKPNMRVLDPFVGAGSTLVATNKLGVDGVGIDIDETYLSIAKERLEGILLK